VRDTSIEDAGNRDSIYEHKRYELSADTTFCTDTVRRCHSSQAQLDKREADERPYVTPEQPCSAAIDKTLGTCYHKALPCRHTDEGKTERR
jgi:hypothetical protein